MAMGLLRRLLGGNTTTTTAEDMLESLPPGFEAKHIGDMGILDPNMPTTEDYGDDQPAEEPLPDRLTEVMTRAGKVAANVIYFTLLAACAVGSIVGVTSGGKLAWAGTIGLALVLTLVALRYFRGSSETRRMEFQENLQKTPRYIPPRVQGLVGKEKVLHAARRAPISMLYSQTSAEVLSVLRRNGKHGEDEDESRRLSGNAVFTLLVIAALVAFVVKAHFPVGLAVFIVLFCVVAYRVARWLVGIHILTDKRVIVQWGVFNRKVNTRALAQIADVEARVSQQARLLAYMGVTRMPFGTLVISSTGEEVLELEFVNGPEELMQELLSKSS